MDYKSALDKSRQGAANIVGLQICGRTVEVYRPRFNPSAGRLKVEYREGALFNAVRERAALDPDALPAEAAEARFFEAPLSGEELDRALDDRPEVLLHRVLGAPDPDRCRTPRDKAAFTSWCIDRLSGRNP